MGKRIMLINATDPEEIRVAVLKEGVLSDYDIEFVHREKIKGNIYKAKVNRVDASLQAAFVHYGGQKNGFLPIAELPRSMTYAPGGRRGRIQDILHKDQEIMIQAVREELGTKGAMVTAQISLPGRYLVLTPTNAVNGISRKIEGQEEREHFKQLVDELSIPNGMGVIVRTASLGVTREDFAKDLGYLVDTYKEVQAAYSKRSDVGLVWQEDDVVTRTLRDSWTPDIEEVHIDDLDTFQSAQAFFRRTLPQYLGVVRHYTGKKPIFSKFQTEEQIDRIYARMVPLPSGGAIVLDQTEALVAIDVNSGKTTGDTQEDTALRTNLEAAVEIASQLRLRDLAGLIAIDFIDVKRETSNKAIMDRLVECLRADKARMEVGRINRFGVLIMTRQRIRPSIQHVTHETCPVCLGSGRVKNLEALVLSVLRRLKSVLSRENALKIQLKLSPEIAMSLLNKRRADLAELESAFETAIIVVPDHGITYGEILTEITHKPAAPSEHLRRKDASVHHRRDPEDEVVVLGGDGPISFERALPASQTDRRGIQRAALDERERLRSLFEAEAPPKEEPPKELKPEPIPKAEPARVKKMKKDAFEGKPKPVKKEVKDIPKLTADVIASLAVPANKARKLISAAAEPSAPQPEAAAGKQAAQKSKTRPASKSGAADQSALKPKEADKQAAPKPKARATSKSGAAELKPKLSEKTAKPAKTASAAKPTAPKPKARATSKAGAAELKPKLSEKTAKPAKTASAAKPKNAGQGATYTPDKDATKTRKTSAKKTSAR